METTNVLAELNMNVLTMPKPLQECGEHGWHTGGTHSYDWSLKYPVVRDWIDNWTAEQTRQVEESSYLPR